MGEEGKFSEMNDFMYGSSYLSCVTLEMSVLLVLIQAGQANLQSMWRFRYFRRCTSSRSRLLRVYDMLLSRIASLCLSTLVRRFWLKTRELKDHIPSILLAMDKNRDIRKAIIEMVEISEIYQRLTPLVS